MPLLRQSAASMRACSSPCRYFASSSSHSFPSSSPAGPSSPSAAQRSEDQLKQMMERLSRSKPVQSDLPGRKTFLPKSLIKPSDLTQQSILARPPRRPRPPPFGPDASLARKSDPFLLTGQKPMDHIYNPLFVQAFVDNVGRIKARSLTGLSRESQRNVKKMVRRARAMGLVSVWSHLPSRQGYGARPGDRYSDH